MSNAVADRDLYISPEEYLAAERVSETRHEYLAGVVYAMSGGSWEHATIAGNIFAALKGLLTGRPCRPHNSDLRVRIRRPDASFYYYPDVTVECTGSRSDFIDDPKVIFEVLSPSTERADCGDKLLNYRTIPSMQVYLIVEQSRPAVTVYRRVEDVWHRETYTDAAAVLDLPEIGCELPLSVIYADIFQD